MDSWSNWPNEAYLKNSPKYGPAQPSKTLLLQSTSSLSLALRIPFTCVCQSHPMKTTATTQGSPAPAEHSSPKSDATKRPRKAAALSDVTNLLLLPETPTPIKPRRTALPQPSDASSTCSSSASFTPAPKRSSAAVLEDESGAVKSPAISTVYARRGTAEAEGRGRRAVPTTSKAKGKAPATAVGTASCPQLSISTGNNNRSGHRRAHPSYQKTLSRSRENTLQKSMPLNCERKRSWKRTWSEN